MGLVLVEMGKHDANSVPFWRYSSSDVVMFLDTFFVLVMLVDVV